MSLFAFSGKKSDVPINVSQRNAWSSVISPKTSRLITCKFHTHNSEGIHCRGPPLLYVFIDQLNWIANRIRLHEIKMAESCEKQTSIFYAQLLLLKFSCACRVVLGLSVTEWTALTSMKTASWEIVKKNQNGDNRVTLSHGNFLSHFLFSTHAQSPHHLSLICIIVVYTWLPASVFADIRPFSWNRNIIIVVVTCRGNCAITKPFSILVCN